MPSENAGLSSRPVRFVAAVLAAVLISAAEARSGARESVAFERPIADGRPILLSGILLRPDGAGPFPAVVLLHHCDGMVGAQNVWAFRLAQWGYATLRVDSFTPRGEVSVCEQPLSVNPFTRADDAHAARVWLAARPDIDRRRIGVIGWSHGGSAAVLSVRKIAGARAEPFRAAIAFYPWCPDLLVDLDAPLQILIGDADDWTPADRCRQMRQVGRTDQSVMLQVYPGAHHGFDGEGPALEAYGYRIVPDPTARADAIRRVRGFLDRYLR